MPNKRFRITLRPYHLKKGLSYYAVAKNTGLSETTVRRYLVNDELIIDKLEAPLFKLAEFLGLGFDRVNEFIELIEDESPDPGETKTPLTLDFDRVALVG